MEKIKFLAFIFNLIKRYIYEWYNIFIVMKKNPSCNFEIGVQIKSPNKLVLGKNVLIQKNTILHCGGMEWSNFKGLISIGDDSVISPNCVLYGAGEIEIGKRFECGIGVKIFSSRSAYSLSLIGKQNASRIFQKVKIGDDVILFSGVIVSVGVSIGNGAVVYAGSIVLEDIPAYEIWGGIPARFIKKRV